MKKTPFPLPKINRALAHVSALSEHPGLNRRQRIIASQAQKYLLSLKPLKERANDALPYLTPGEVAQRFHVHVVTVRSWASRGLIGHISTPGGHRRFPIADVERFAREHR